MRMASKPGHGLKHVLAGFKSIFRRSQVPLDAPVQQRRAIRVRCSYRVMCETPSRAFKAVVVDLSWTGMRVEVPHRLQPGMDIALRYDPDANEIRWHLGADVVRARILWCRKRRSSPCLEAGLSFYDSDQVVSRSWVRAMLRHL